MNTFKDASFISQMIQEMQTVGLPRSRNRARIADLFNGNPPYTDSEARDNRIETNVNFLEGTRIIHQARQQFTDAFMKPSNFFTVSLDKGPVFKREQWGSIITKQLNKRLKRDMRFTEVLDSQFASSVLHGVGPVTWGRRKDWCPSARGLDDMLVPSRTLKSLENLTYFATRNNYTVADLVRMTGGKNVDRGWNMPLVQSVLASLRAMTGQQNQQDYSQYDLERLAEDFKENSGFWGSDAAPTVQVFDFYYLDEQAKKWSRKLILDPQTAAYDRVQSDVRSGFLYEGRPEYGSALTEILHVQFADGAVVPPFRWHTVRSLGYLLYSVCHLQNRIRCKFSDSVFESMLWYFRDVATGDEERVNKVELKHLGIIPEGLAIVPPSERHTINEGLVGSAMSMNRQMMNESSASYTNDVDNGTNKEQTATEIMAKVTSANALVGSMLNRAYSYAIPLYRELGRRFCTLDHPDCKAFRDACLAEGVDASVFDVECWGIEPERAMGNGNKMMSIAQSDRLMAVRAAMPPAAQQRVLHMYVEANTDDPLLADRLIPMEVAAPSKTIQIATLAWGTLIDGQPVVLSDGVNNTELVQVWLEMLDTEIQRINNSGGTPDVLRVQGLANVIATIEGRVAIIAQDPANVEMAKQMKDALGKASNFVQAYIQRIQEQQQAQQQQAGGDPTAQAKVQAMLIEAKAKAEIKQAEAAQKMQNKQTQFEQGQQQKATKTMAEIATGDTRTAAEILRSNARAQAEAANAALEQPAGPDSPQ